MSDLYHGEYPVDMTVDEACYELLLRAYRKAVLDADAMRPRGPRSGSMETYRKFLAVEANAQAALLAALDRTTSDIAVRSEVYEAALALCHGATDDCTGKRTVFVDPDDFDNLNAALGVDLSAIDDGEEKGLPGDGYAPGPDDAEFGMSDHRLPAAPASDHTS